MCFGIVVRFKRLLALVFTFVFVFTLFPFNLSLLFAYVFIVAQAKLCEAKLGKATQSKATDGLGYAAQRCSILSQSMLS